MEIHDVLQEYDSLFGKTTLAEIEAYLYQKIREAIEEQDDSAILTLLNEMIGLCRDTSQKEKALVYCAQLKKLMVRMNLEGTRDYATSMQNIANAYRAFGQWDAAEEAFQSIEKTYKMCLNVQYEEICNSEECSKNPALLDPTISNVHFTKDDYLWASLYNNWGLLYQEQQKYAKSVETLQKSFNVIVKVPNSAIKQAITKTNLANSLLGLQTEEAVQTGYVYITEALAVFVEDGEKDFHYGAALVAMGDYLVHKSQWKQAKEYYQKGLVELLIHTGKTDFYQRVVEKYENVVAKLQPSATWKNNLVRSREFYEQYGKEMIHNLFPEYEQRIAVGMVGEGSDCFGFDDEISMDHDYAVGFCMWLTKEDRCAIGSELQEAYDKLLINAESEATRIHKESSQNSTELNVQIPNVRFITKHGENICLDSKVYDPNMERLSNRRGVFEIDAFYESDTEEWKLAELVNGEVFRDDLGLFTEKRNALLAYYSEDVWRKKLANALHEFSQYGQANYARMMAREDYVTANLCISKAIESAMDIAYVLREKYAPYYKWKRKGLEQTGKMNDVLWICEELSLISCQKKAWENKTYSSREINIEDKCVVLLETLAGIILEKMKAKQLVEGTDLFLETYIEQILV